MTKYIHARYQACVKLNMNMSEFFNVSIVRWHRGDMCSFYFYDEFFLFLFSKYRMCKVLNVMENGVSLLGATSGRQWCCTFHYHW